MGNMAPMRVVVRQLGGNRRHEETKQAEVNSTVFPGLGEKVRHTRLVQSVGKGTTTAELAKSLRRDIGDGGGEGRLGLDQQVCMEVERAELEKDTMRAAEMRQDVVAGGGLASPHRVVAEDMYETAVELMCEDVRMAGFFCPAMLDARVRNTIFSIELHQPSIRFCNARHFFHIRIHKSEVCHLHCYLCLPNPTSFDWGGGRCFRRVGGRRRDVTICCLVLACL